MIEKVQVATTLPSRSASGLARPGLAWRRFASPVAGLAGAWLLVAIFAAVFAPWLAPHDPVRQGLSRRLLPPAWQAGSDAAFLLGTDHLGRDILTRIMYGGRISLSVGILTVLLAVTIGVTLGLLAGFYGRWIDDLITRLIDIQLSVPYLLLAIALVMIIGPSVGGLVFVLTLYGWTVFARLTRAEVLSARERDYVLAGRAMGVSNLRLLTRHILPNVLNPIIVMATLEMANVIIFEAGLSFLGLGVQPPTPSWGNMLADSRDYLLIGVWWPATFPGLAITLVILAINTLGDWVRDVLDPRFRPFNG